MSRKILVPNSKQQPVVFNTAEKDRVYKNANLDFYSSINTNSRSEETVKKVDMNDKRPVSLHYGSGYAVEGNKYGFSTPDTAYKTADDILDEMFGEEPKQIQINKKMVSESRPQSAKQKVITKSLPEEQQKLEQVIEHKQRIRKKQQYEAWCGSCQHLFEVLALVETNKGVKTSCPVCKSVVDY